MALPHLTRGPSSPLNPSVSVHLCTFSPCIEQVQRTVSALRSLGWLEIEMVELSAHRIEVRRDRVGLQEEGLPGVNASPANVEEAIGRLREVEGRDRSYHHGKTSQPPVEDPADEAAGEYVSKQQRLQNIREAQTDRKLYKEGRLTHRSEPELKTHTSYLVFAILPRAWTDEDERQANALVSAGPLNAVNSRDNPTSKRQMKRDAKEQAGGNKDIEIKTERQINDAAKHKYPIFTLQILGKDVHIVNYPDLIIAVQKNPRIYDFSVFASMMLPRLFDLDKKTMELASRDLPYPGGSWNLIVETSRIFHRCLSPGPSLEKMEQAALTRILGYLNELASDSDGVVLDLFAWLRTMMTVSSTAAFGLADNVSI
ncbi:MAG: hypothetical protein Q9205_007921 [Flavoplaca limonia]